MNSNTHNNNNTHSSIEALKRHIIAVVLRLAQKAKNRLYYSIKW